jgi:thioredoxin-related protein
MEKGEKVIRSDSSRIKKWLLALVLLFAPFICPADGAALEGIQWRSYAEGMELRQSQSKKIFLNFYADWCQYCTVMEKETFQNTAVVAYINRNFIPVKVNSDADKKTAALFQVTGLPSTWFISETGERIGNRPGYISASELLPILKYIGSNSYQKMSFSAFLKSE